MLIKIASPVEFKGVLRSVEYSAVEAKNFKLLAAGASFTTTIDAAAVHDLTSATYTVSQFPSHPPHSSKLTRHPGQRRRSHPIRHRRVHRNHLGRRLQIQRPNHHRLGIRSQRHRKGHPIPLSHRPNRSPKRMLYRPKVRYHLGPFPLCHPLQSRLHCCFFW